MYSLAGCKTLSKSGCEAVCFPWRVELSGLPSESPDRECLVSYLAVPGLPRRIEDAADEGTRKTFGLVRHFTQCYGAETPGSAGEPQGSVGEPVCFDDGSSGTVAANFVRARPVGPNAGSVPLVLELLDLLHIQLECLAGERIVRGAVAIDSLRCGPNGDVSASSDVAANADDVPNGDVAANGDGVPNRDGAQNGGGAPNRDIAPSRPALTRAREMAANEATFPRIAVAEEIVSRLRSDMTLRVPDHFLRAEVDLVDCLLRGDGSGGYYIDYLRAGLGEFDYDFDRYAAFLGHHKRIVESGLAGTPPWSTPGTCDWLKRYHNARIDDDLTRPADGTARADECDRGMAGVLTPLRIA